MSFVLALDQGTTSSRAIVFDHAGAIRGAAQKEFRQIFPQPGWVEHDPTEIWSTQSGVVTEALASARHRRQATSPRIGITNQRETTRAVGSRHRQADRQRHRLAGPPHGRHLRRAARSRATSRCSRARPAWCSTPTSPAPSSNGCSTTCPVRARAPTRGELAFGTVDTWLIWNLTGGAVHVTDRQQRRRARCCSTSTRGDWDDELLALARRSARDAARGRRIVERCLRRGDAARRTRSRSPASPATSRRRCSARPASSPAWPRTPTAPAASC